MSDHDPSAARPATRWADTAAPRGAAYDQRWDQLAAAGHDPHGEATFVMRFVPGRVLDAGCGTGRVARELARRGVAVVGVDVDAVMLATARAKAPELQWIEHDLASLDLARDPTVNPPSSYCSSTSVQPACLWMYPTHESRWASSELKSWSSPAEVDLRV